MYCVKCGVELGDSEKKNARCAAPRSFTRRWSRPKGDGPYPPEEHIHKEVSRSGALFVVTVLTVLPIVICLLCDWRINGGIVWSGYVTGALLMCYIVIVLPLWFRRGNPVIFLSRSILWRWGLPAVYRSGYRWALVPFPCFSGGGGGRYYCHGNGHPAALPARWTPVCIRWGVYSSGGLMVLVEFLINLTFKLHDALLWSIYPLAAGIILGLTLIIIGCCRPLRESLQKKFFL